MNHENQRLREQHLQLTWQAIKSMPEVFRRRQASRAQAQFLRMPPPREALPCPPKWSPLWWAIQRRKEKKRRLAPSLGTRVLPVPATPAPAVEWTTLTAAQKAAWSRALFREAARARLGAWMATRIDELMLEHLSGQTGTTSLLPPDP